jgi:hypothetical protein
VHRTEAASAQVFAEFELAEIDLPVAGLIALAE